MPTIDIAQLIVNRTPKKTGDSSTFLFICSMSLKLLIDDQVTSQLKTYCLVQFQSELGKNF